MNAMDVRGWGKQRMREGRLKYFRGLENRRQYMYRNDIAWIFQHNLDFK